MLAVDWGSSEEALRRVARAVAELSSETYQERRLLTRAMRLARGERGDRVSPALLDAVLIGRLPGRA
jgi:hypothetical protein